MALIPLNIIAALLSSADLRSIILALVSMSTIAVFMFMPKVRDDERRTAIRALLILYALEAAIGFSQAVLSAPSIFQNPDIVQGTFGPGGPRIVAIYSIAAASYYWTASRSKFRHLWVLLYLSLFILTFSIAIGFAALAALLMGVLLSLRAQLRRTPRRKHSLRILLGIASLTCTAVLATLAPERDRIFDVMEKINETPRLRLTVSAITDLPAEAPWQPIIGLGAGQFASWASAICDPRYRAAKLAGKHVQSTGTYDCSNAIAREQIFEPYYAELNVLAESIAGHPLFSVLTFYTEWGLLGLAWFVYVIAKTQARALRSYTQSGDKFYLWARFCVLFFAFLCLLDLFAEYPHVAYPLLLPALVGVPQKGPRSK